MLHHELLMDGEPLDPPFPLVLALHKPVVRQGSMFPPATYKAPPYKACIPPTGSSNPVAVRAGVYGAPGHSSMHSTLT